MAAGSWTINEHYLKILLSCSLKRQYIAISKIVIEHIYSHCLFDLLCAYSHNIHCFSNCIHTHLIKAIGHEDKVGTAESKLCNEQKQIHSKSVISCELCEVVAGNCMHGL